MFIGHYAVAFAVPRWAPSLSLGTLFLACQLADLLWPSFVLLGFEQFEIDTSATAVIPINFINYPYSHSLIALLVWGLVFAALYLSLRRGRLAAAAVLAGVVLSHWFLDVATHRPDMPLTLFGETRLGFGMWSSLPLTIAVEGVLFGAGVLLYARATQARDRVGRVAFWSLVGFLVLVYAASIFGPPPPSTTAVAWSAQALWLMVLLGYWVDRHREPREQVAA